MGKKYAYEESLMENIASKFKDGADTLEEMIEEFGYFKNSFIQYYDGQANNEIFETLSDTFDSHLQLLKLCYENMEKYVTNTKEEMIEADAAVGSSINNGHTGSHHGKSVHTGTHHGGNGGRY